MGKDFKVKVHDGTERAEVYMKVFGRTEVCVLSPLPVLVGVPDFDEPQAAYMLDLKEITDDERARLMTHLSERFGHDVKEVSDWVNYLGVPILATECMLTIENPQRWIDLSDSSVENLYEDFEEDWDEDED